MKLSFVKLNPAGNTTILVTTFVPLDKQKEVATILMSPLGIGAEQVGFLSSTSSLRMMGNEFCGNATRCTAAYAAYTGVSTARALPVLCSGNSNPIHCTVKTTEKEHTFWVEASMPTPLSIIKENISLSIGEVDLITVTFEGITHYIIPTSASHTEKLYTEVLTHIDTSASLAIGVLFYNEIKKSLVPIVYVGATETTYWENSCASGTTAIGAWLLKEGIAPEEPLSIEQPGGTLTIRFESADIFLSSDISITAVGEAYL